MTKQQVLDKVQNQVLRIITGSIRSTPIKAMETTAAVQPQSQMRGAQIMVQAKKLKSLPNHPMKERMNGLTKNHYKCSSFVHESKRLACTDGSATDAVKNGGAGAYVKFPEGEIQSASIPTGKYCSNYMAEIQALVCAGCLHGQRLQQQMLTGCLPV